MIAVRVLAVLLGAACFLGGCTGLTQASEETKASTRQVALLIQSVNDSSASFQRQRDTIAVATLAQRQALESLALRNEAAVLQSTAAWEVAGQSERGRAFDTLRASSAQLLARLSDARAREQAHAQALREARSAVRLQGAKLSEASTTLMTLAEGSDAEQASFYLAYARAVREKIKQDSEAQAAQHTSDTTKDSKHE